MEHLRPLSGYGAQPDFATSVFNRSGVAMTDEIQQFATSVSSIYDSERMLCVALGFITPGPMGQTEISTAIQSLREEG